MLSVIASNIVVISGPAMIAGSNLNVLATIGREVPIILESITTNTRVMETVKAIFKSTFVKAISLTKLIAANTIDTITEMKNSFFNTLNASLVEISPSAKARTTIVDD